MGCRDDAIFSQPGVLIASKTRFLEEAIGYI